MVTVNISPAPSQSLPVISGVWTYTNPRSWKNLCMANAAAERTLKAALKDPEFIKKQEGLGAVVVNDARANPAEHKKFVAAEVAKWGAVIKAAGQYAD